jgi:hypothetical protein
MGSLLRSSQVCARSVRLGTGRLGLADGRAPSGQHIPTRRLQLDRGAPQVRWRSLRSGGAERSAARCRRPRGQHLLPAGTIATSACPRSGCREDGHAGGRGRGRYVSGVLAWRRLLALGDDLPIAQGRVDGGAIHASRAVRRSLGLPAARLRSGGASQGEPEELRAHDRTTRQCAAFQTSVFSAISSASSTSTPR